MKKSVIRAGMLITADDLRKMGACSDQWERFAYLYPKGLKLTTRNLNIAHHRHMQTVWFIDRALYLYRNNRESSRQWLLYRKKFLGGYNWRRISCFHSAFIAILKERDT